MFSLITVTLYRQAFSHTSEMSLIKKKKFFIPCDLRFLISRESLFTIARILLNFCGLNGSWREKKNRFPLYEVSVEQTEGLRGTIC